MISIQVNEVLCRVDPFLFASNPNLSSSYFRSKDFPPCKYFNWVKQEIRSCGYLMMQLSPELWYLTTVFFALIFGQRSNFAFQFINLLLPFVDVVCSDYSKQRSKNMTNFFIHRSLPLVYFQVLIERNQMYFLHLFEWPREQQHDHFLYFYSLVPTWKFETNSNSKANDCPLVSGIVFTNELNLFSSCFLNIKISVVEEFLNKRSENSNG